MIPTYSRVWKSLSVPEIRFNWEKKNGRMCSTPSIQRGRQTHIPFSCCRIGNTEDSIVSVSGRQRRESHKKQGKFKGHLIACCHSQHNITAWNQRRLRGEHEHRLHYTGSSVCHIWTPRSGRGRGQDLFWRIHILLARNRYKLSVGWAIVILFWQPWHTMNTPIKRGAKLRLLSNGCISFGGQRATERVY